MCLIWELQAPTKRLLEMVHFKKREEDSADHQSVFRNFNIPRVTYNEFLLTLQRKNSN